MNTRAKKKELVEAGKSALTQEQPAIAPRFVSRKQVAKLGSMCVESVKRWEKRGILKPIKLSARMVRYDLEQVMRAFSNAA